MSSLGKALAGRWDDVVLAAKTGAGDEAGKLSRRRIVQRLDASLRRRATDHGDLYYVKAAEWVLTADEVRELG